MECNSLWTNSFQMLWWWGDMQVDLWYNNHCILAVPLKVISDEMGKQPLIAQQFIMPCCMGKGEQESMNREAHWVHDFKAPGAVASGVLLYFLNSGQFTYLIILWTQGKCTSSALQLAPWCFLFFLTALFPSICFCAGGEHAGFCSLHSLANDPECLLGGFQSSLVISSAQGSNGLKRTHHTRHPGFEGG